MSVWLTSLVREERRKESLQDALLCQDDEIQEEPTDWQIKTPVEMHLTVLGSICILSFQQDDKNVGEELSLHKNIQH